MDELFATIFFLSIYIYRIIMLLIRDICNTECY